MFAWTVCKHTKSNAIVYARAGQTVGVGAGQMSRVDSVRIGAMRAQHPVEGSVLASDAFFPFRDGLDEAARTASPPSSSPAAPSATRKSSPPPTSTTSRMVFTRKNLKSYFFYFRNTTSIGKQYVLGNGSGE
jgi:hypothetical protein